MSDGGRQNHSTPLFLFLFTVMSLLVFHGRTRRREKNRTQAHAELALGRLPKCEILESIGGRRYRQLVSCFQLLACLVEKVPIVYGETVVLYASHSLIFIEIYI